MFLAERLFSIPISFFSPFYTGNFYHFFFHYNPNNVSGNTLFSLVEPFQTQNILIT